MDLALQLFFTGLGIGAVYALVALGFVLIFRATNVVNFAQGEFAMVGAYLMVVFAVDLHWPYGWAFVAALAGMALLGVVFNLGVYYPLRHRTFLPVIIATIGASIFLAEHGARALWAAAAGALALVRDAGAADRAGLPRHPVPAHPGGDAASWSRSISGSSSTPARQEAAGDLAGQGDGLAARHSRWRR